MRFGLFGLGAPLAGGGFIYDPRLHGPVDESAVLWADFKHNAVLANGSPLQVSKAFDLDRATIGWGIDASGVVHQYGADEPRVGSAGLYTGPPIEQYFPSPDCTGAVVGVVGSGGALPDDWSVVSTDSIEVLSIGSTNGIPWVEVVWTKDNSGGGAPAYPRLKPDVATLPSATAGDVFTASVWAEISSTTHDISVIAEEKDGSYGYLASSAAVLTNGRNEVTRETTDLSLSYVIGQIGPTVPDGEVFSATLKIGIPNLTKTRYLAQPIIDASVTAADKINFDLSGADLTDGFYGVWRGEIAGWNDNWDRVLEVGSIGGQDYVMLRANGSASQLRLSFYDGSEVEKEPAPASGGILWSGYHEIIFGVGPNFTQLIIDGVATSVADLASYSPVGLTTLFLGTSQSEGSFGTICTHDLIFVPDQPTTEILT
ncbi:hypothetical protein, partial [Cohaesibacter celericrescens]|uniref:hypothetical protein n=1 Tax=Cohaesibacter celericrescens TaxID=2067669 RepID=UPI003568663E